MASRWLLAAALLALPSAPGCAPAPAPAPVPAPVTVPAPAPAPPRLVEIPQPSASAETAPAPTYGANAADTYARGLDEYNAQSWDAARATFAEVKRKFAYSKYAVSAELRIVDIDFKQGKLEEAIRGYRQFVHDHRANMEDVAYARAQITEAAYQHAASLPAGETKKTALREAATELRGFVHDYPDREETKRARTELATVEQQLGASRHPSP